MGLPPNYPFIDGFSIINHPAIRIPTLVRHPAWAPPRPHQAKARWPPDSGDPTGRPRTWLWPGRGHLEKKTERKIGKKKFRNVEKLPNCVLKMLKRAKYEM